MSIIKTVNTHNTRLSNLGLKKKTKNKKKKIKKTKNKKKKRKKKKRKGKIGQRPNICFGTVTSVSVIQPSTPAHKLALNVTKTGQIVTDMCKSILTWAFC